MRAALPVAAALLLGAAGPAASRTLAVGEGREFAMPSAAIDAAADGDTVLIAPGSYFDCGIVRRDRLTIAGEAPGAVLTDRACEGKGLLVIRGADTTIRDLTLARARVPDGNGAGIRLERPGLELQRVTFENDQVGLLSGVEGGAIRLADCVVNGGGVDGDRPTFAVMSSRADLLRIERSVVRGFKGGAVSSAAVRTELLGNRFDSGSGADPGQVVVIPDGALLLEESVLGIGPAAPRRDAAVLLLNDATAVLRGNTLVNQTGRTLTLLLDWSSGSPTLASNVLAPGDRTVSTSGIWRHRASDTYYGTKAGVRALAGRVKRSVEGWLR